MSIYNPNDFNNDSNYVQLPYLQKLYTTKTLLSSTLSPVQSDIEDHETRITDLENADHGPEYLPLIPKLSSTLEFFGDSITAGYGLSSVLTQRFSYLVCQALGKTQANYGVNSDMIQDLAKRVFASHSSGNTSIMSIGTNDCMKLPNQVVMDEYVRSLESSVLYSCLPVLSGTGTGTGWKIVNSRNLNYVTRSGTWTNTADSVGLTSSTIDSYLEATVNGRYVCFDFGTFVGSTNVSHADVTVTIDGVFIENWAVITKLTTTANGCNYVMQPFVYDTGVTGNHTLRVTLKNYAKPLIVNYMGAFDQSQTGASQVYVAGPPIMDNAYHYELNSSVFIPLDSSITTYFRDNMKRMVRKLRDEYGLPCYYVDWGAPNISNLQGDQLHFSPKGNQYIANRILYVMNNGEYDTNKTYVSTGGSGVGSVFNGGQNGNVTIGSNDASALALETNNVTRMSIDSAGLTTFNNIVKLNNTSSPNFSIGTSSNIANRLTFNETNPPPSETGTVVSFGSGSNSRNMVFAIGKTGVRTGFFGQDGSALVVGQESTGGIAFKTGMSYGSSNILGSGTTQFVVDAAGVLIPATKNIRMQGSTSGTLTIASPAAYTSYTLTLPTSAPSAASTYALTADSTGVCSWIDTKTLTGWYILNGGNTNSANLSLGTKDNFNVSLKQNNIDRVTITSSSVDVNNNLSVAGSVASNAYLIAYGTASTDGQLILFQNSTSGTNRYTLKAPSSLDTDITLSLPSSKATSNNQVLACTNITTGALGWVDQASVDSSLFWSKGGQTTGADASIGLNDNYTLNIKQNGQNKIQLFSTSTDINSVLNVSGNINTFGMISAKNSINVNGSSSLDGRIQLFQNTTSGYNNVSLKAPAGLTSDVELILPTSTGSNGQVLTSGPSGLYWSDSVVNGGNSTSSALVIGTNSNYGLTFRTNNTNRGGFDASGKLTLVNDADIFGALSAGSASIGGNIGITGNATVNGNLTSTNATVTNTLTTSNATVTGTQTFSNTSGANIGISKSHNVDNRLSIGPVYTVPANDPNTIVCFEGQNNQNIMLQLRRRAGLNDRTAWIGQNGDLVFAQQSVGGISFRNNSVFTASDILTSGNLLFRILSTGAYIPSNKSLILGGNTGGNLTIASPDTYTDYTLRFPTAQGSVGQALVCTNTTTGQLGWVGIGAGTGDIINGGNAGNISIGTTTADNLVFKTNNTNRLTIDQYGLVTCNTAINVPEVMYTDGNMSVGTTGSYTLNLKSNGVAKVSITPTNTLISSSVQITSGNDLFVGGSTLIDGAVVINNTARCKGSLSINADGTAGEVRLYDSSDTYTTSLKCGTIAGNVNVSLPTSSCTLTGAELNNTWSGTNTFSKTVTFNNTSHPNVSIGTSGGIANRLTFNENNPPINDTNTITCFGSGNSSRNCLFQLSKTGVRSGWFGQSSDSLVIGEESVGTIAFRTGMDYTSANILGSGSLNMSIDSNGVVIPQSKNLRLLGSTSGTLTIIPPAAVTDYTLTLPSTAGTNGQVLTTNGSGVLSWTTAGNVFNGGQSGAVTLGTTDDNRLKLVRGNIERLVFESSSSLCYGPWSFLDSCSSNSFTAFYGILSGVPGSISFGNVLGKYTKLIASSVQSTDFTYELPPAPTVSGRALASYTDGIMYWSDVSALTSDARVKNSISDLSVNDAINSIKKLQIRKYKFNESYAREYGKSADRFYSGIVAQELEETHPYLVQESCMKVGNELITDFKQIKVEEINMDLIKTVQHLLQEVGSLKNEIELLKSK